MKIWMKAAVATLVLAMHAWGATAVLAGLCQPSVAEVRVGPLQTLWPDFERIMEIQAILHTL